VCGVLRLIGCVPQNIALLKYRQTLSLKAPNCKRNHSGNIRVQREMHKFLEKQTN